MTATALFKRLGDLESPERKLEELIAALGSDTVLSLEAQIAWAIEELSALDTNKMVRGLTKTQAQKRLDLLFQIQFKLHEKWSKFALGSSPSDEMVRRIRATYNHLMRMKDELFLRRHDLRSAKHFLLAKEAPVRLSVSPDVKLRSGDILVSRATAFISGVIARMTEVAGIHSHLVVLYIDAPAGTELTVEEAIQDPRVFVVEAHGLTGSTIFPLRDFLRTEHARMSLLRSHLSPEQAHRAAHHIHDYIQSRGNVAYDFKLNTQDTATIFCSQIAEIGYRAVGLALPTFPSVIRPNQVIELMGLSVPRSFAPSDLDIEPHFQTLAEWRDPGQLRDILLIDTLFDAAFDWIEKFKYRTQFTWRDRALAYTLWKIRNLELGLQKKIPKGIRVFDAVLSIYLQRFGNLFLHHLRKFDQGHRALNSAEWPSPRELREELDRFRKIDAEDFAAGRPTKIHRIFRAK